MGSGDGGGGGGGGGGSSRGEPRRIVLVRRKPRTLTKLAIPSLLLALSLSLHRWPGNRVYIAAPPFLPFLRVSLTLSLCLSPSSYARWLCCSRYNPVHMYLLCVSMRFASVIPRSRRISPRSGQRLSRGNCVFHRIYTWPTKVLHLQFFMNENIRVKEIYLRQRV